MLLGLHVERWWTCEEIVCESERSVYMSLRLSLHVLGFFGRLWLWYGTDAESCAPCERARRLDVSLGMLGIGHGRCNSIVKSCSPVCRDSGERDVWVYDTKGRMAGFMAR